MITVKDFIDAIKKEANLADVDIYGATLTGIGSSMDSKTSQYKVNLILDNSQHYTINIPKHKDNYNKKYKDIREDGLYGSQKES